MIIYIIIAILIGIFGSMKFYGDSKYVSLLLFLIGSILIFVFFGRRWFGDNQLFNRSPGQWPPVINTCPDYLTYFKRRMPDGSSKDTCIDRTGVSRNSTLMVFPKDGNQNPPASDSYYFDLKTSSSEATAARAELCQRTIQYGLTWEGITDGESCYSPSGTGETIIPAVPFQPGSCPTA